MVSAYLKQNQEKMGRLLKKKKRNQTKRNKNLLCRKINTKKTNKKEINLFPCKENLIKPKMTNGDYFCHHRTKNRHY